MSPRTRVLVKRVAVGAGCVVVTVAGVLGAEVYLALNHDYLATEPALEIGGDFGPPGGDHLTLVVLGDSTAAGVGAGDAAHAYPTLLAQRLAEEGMRVHLVALGMSGARVGDLAREQVPRAIDANPDLVFIGIGANDVTHLTPLGDVERDMVAALDALQRETTATVVVAGAPDMRAAAFLEPLRSIVGWRGRRVADAIENAAQERHVRVMPLAERTAPFFVDDPEEHYSADDFHPSAAGYRRWADAIFPALLSALEAAAL